MSSAIKRLSTIIRPSSSPSSPPKDNGKDTIDAPAPAAPVLDNPADTTAPADPPAPTANGNGTTAAPADMKETITASSPDPVPADDTAPAELAKDKDPAPAPADTKKDKDPKVPPPHRRDPRDIGRSTIRRFSTILRSPGRDANKDPSAPASDEAKPAEDPAQPEDPAKKDKDEGGPEPAAADQPAKTSAPGAAAKDAGKTSPRRPSGFFTAAREGLQRTAKDVQTRARPSRPPKEKAVPKPEAAVVPKIVKKGAARGKHVVVVTGASKGVGLQFVKQLAAQPNTFVIALSRTADKSPALKPVVAASAKEGHNVRALKLDITSTRSTNSVVKDIVELTDGRVDLLINAAGSRGNPVLKVWDLKGSELEDELRNNLVGPIAFTNALLPYLKPVPPKEEKKEKAEEKEKDKELTYQEETDRLNARAEELEAKLAEHDAEAEKRKAKAEKLEAKPEAKAEKAEKLEVNAEQLEAKAEKLEALKPDVAVPTVKPDVEGAAAPAGASELHQPPAPAPQAEQHVEPPPAGPAPEAAKPSEERTAEAAAPAEPAPAPAFLPAQPFIVFLAPADPIQNAGGTVPTGSVFAPAPRTLFSLSRAPLQVAIAKYAVGLGGRGVGVVGVERHGQHDPHAEVSDEQAAAAVVGLLPGLSVRDNGKLLRVA